MLRGPEFRLLWQADLQSQLGDQLARVALSVSVYERTQSALATAAVYALTFLPALFGSVLLGPLADRLPRRGLLVGGDLIRALLLAAMVVPGLTVPVLSALLVLAVLVGIRVASRRDRTGCRPARRRLRAGHRVTGVGCSPCPGCWVGSSSPRGWPRPTRNRSPAGVLIGTVVYSRWLSAGTRTVLLGPLAAVAGIPPLACAMTPGLAVSCALCVVCVGTQRRPAPAYQVQVVTEFVQQIPPAFVAKA